MIPTSRRSGSLPRTSVPHRRGAILVLGAGIVFSFGPLTFRAAQDADAWQFLTYRGLSTAIAMAVVLGLRYRTGAARLIVAADRRQLLAGIVLATLFILFITSLARTTAAMVLLLQAAAPFSAALIGWLWLGERLRRVTIIAMVSAAIGIAMMVGTGIEAGRVSGVVLAACIPLLLGLYTVLIRSATTWTDPAVTAFIAGAVAFVVAGTIALTRSGLEVSFRDATMACISGGVLLGIGLPLFITGNRAVPAAETTLLLMSEIVLAPIWVWIWPGETPGAGTIVGGLIILTSLAGWAVASGSRS